MSAHHPPIHQLVHTLSYGDAISTEVVALQRTLRELGYESSIFSIHAHPRMREYAIPYQELDREKPADVLFHYSLGSPLNDLYRNWGSGRRTLIYHNITPAKWFRGINNRVADDIERGIQDLPELCRLSDTIWVDSPFNGSELGSLGFSSSVLDLLVDPGRWSTPANKGLSDSVSASSGIQVLHVGRLAPNKCVEDVIKSFYFLWRYWDSQARLRIVGIDTDTELYSFALRDLAAHLGCENNVEFTGGLADDEVRALYESSDVYLSMSEHEGFCLPLIEAMHFGLPVIAFAAGAVPETLGTAGILVHEKRHAEIGLLLSEVGRPSALRNRVIESGRRRVGDFSYERFTARVGELIAEQPIRREVRAV